MINRALIPDIEIRHHQVLVLVYSVNVVPRQTTDATNDLYTNKGYADSTVYNLHLDTQGQQEQTSKRYGACQPPPNTNMLHTWLDF